MNFHLHIDHPPTWELPSRNLIVRGWCLDDRGLPLGGIRLRLGGLLVPGVVGVPRPDVQAAIPEARHRDSGFEVRAVVPRGISSISLEALSASGKWQEILGTRLTLHSQGRPFWLGGGSPREIVAFQLPAHPKYAPRLVRMEQYPRVRADARTLPRLAVVTPSFNQAPFLAETIRSVLGQTGVSVDYVVQDGGSTDGSRQVIERFASASNVVPPGGLGSAIRPNPPSSGHPEGPRLVGWASEPDKGQADAIARGFSRTNGRPEDLMAWINSDDFYLPGALAYVADWFRRHPAVDVAYGHRILVDEQSREVGRWHLPGHDDRILRLNDFVPQETLFWRRRLWDRVGGLDTGLAFAMDWDLLLRFQDVGARIVRLPRFLACFRLHPAQKTSAAMHSVGQNEIDRLRQRSHGRVIPPVELENNPLLLRYLRRSAFIEWLWSMGVRAP